MIHAFFPALKRHKGIILLIIVAAAFFVFTSSLNYFSQDKDFVKWLSPDETANYTIAKVYAETGSLQFFEKYNLVSKDIIHPRSFRSDLGWIKPVSFLGLPILYGWLGSIFGTVTLPYITPFIGALGIIFFYLLIKELFNKHIGLLSAVLLAVFPVYIYFSARSFFHNILFIVSLIAGLYFSVKMKQKKPFEQNFPRPVSISTPYLLSFLAGLCFALAITARTSELMWVAPLLLTLYIFNCRKISFLKIIFLLAGLGVGLAPTLYWNQVLYGAWYASGYPELNNSLGTLTESGSALAQTTFSGNFFGLKPLLAKIKMTIFHFGFKPEQSLKMFNKYVLVMFPWLFWAGAAGLTIFLLNVKQYTWKRWLYILAWGMASLILVIYYGSWVFYDNPDPNSFTIGNSYTRYWLPLYLGAISLASVAIATTTNWLRKPLLIMFTRFVIVVAIAIISIQFVWNDPSEGLKVSIEKQRAAKQEWQQVLNETESRAVIITRYHDKLLFPERKVVIGLFNDKNMITEYAALTEHVPVYYYNFTLPEKDVTYLNNGPLREHSIQLEVVKQITKDFTLYQLSPLTLLAESN